MVLGTSRFFAKRLNSQSKAHRPMFSHVSSVSGQHFTNYISETKYRLFWRWFKRSPELIGTINVPITDILGDRPKWTAPDGSPLGRNKLRQARKFWRDNRGKEVLRSVLFDEFITGDGYLWMGFADKKGALSTVKEVLKKHYSKTNLQIKSKAFSHLIAKTVDEVQKIPRKLDYVPSSNVQVMHDEFDIFGYEQVIAGKIAEFTPEEIIHFRYRTMNGEVNGFSPVEALASEIILLTLVKENMLAFMRNGGTPDKMFILPKEIAKSKNHQFLIEQLRKYKRVQNSHGNMVFTGEIDVKDLQGNPKDLEYKDLALYIASNIAFAFNIPVTRIPYLIGSSANKGGTGGLSESGYWNSISDKQDTIEDVLNGQLFEKLGWHIKFQRKYKQDEVREAQTASMNADTVTKYQSILMANDLQLTTVKSLSLMGFSPEDVEQKQETMAEVKANKMVNQNMLDKNSLNKEEDEKDKASRKSNTANQKGSKEAVANP